jgi:hypothetical protein
MSVTACHLDSGGSVNPLRDGPKSPGDEVELVAFGVGKADPLVIVLAQ